MGIEAEDLAPRVHIMCDFRRGNEIDVLLLAHYFDSAMTNILKILISVTV